jgi:hypothetical protein
MVAISSMISFLTIKDKPNLVVFNMTDSESSIMIRVSINMNYCVNEEE